MARQIRTPRERPEEPTLISGLIREFEGVRERQRARLLEAEDRRRQQEFEDLQKEALTQNIAINRATAQRNIFGLEPEGGSLVPRTGQPPTPGRRLLAPPARQPEPGRVGGRATFEPFRPEQRSLLEPSPTAGAGPAAAPAPTRIGRTGPGRTPLTPLEPARDPTIVHPELAPRPARQQFQFRKFEQQLELPEGSLTQSFDENPVGTLNVIIDRVRRTGQRLATSELNALRSIVQTRINSVEQQISESILSPQEEIQLRDEIDALTTGLLDAAVGGQAELDPAKVTRELRRMFPNEDEDEFVARFQRIQEVRRRARDFSRRARPFLQPQQPQQQ